MMNMVEFPCEIVTRASFIGGSSGKFTFDWKLSLNECVPHRLQGYNERRVRPSVLEGKTIVVLSLWEELLSAPEVDATLLVIERAYWDLILLAIRSFETNFNIDVLKQTVSGGSFEKPDVDGLASVAVTVTSRGKPVDLVLAVQVNCEKMPVDYRGFVSAFQPQDYLLKPITHISKEISLVDLSGSAVKLVDLLLSLRKQPKKRDLVESQPKQSLLSDNSPDERHGFRLTREDGDPRYGRFLEHYSLGEQPKKSDLVEFRRKTREDGLVGSDSPWGPLMMKQNHQTRIEKRNLLIDKKRRAMSSTGTFDLKGKQRSKFLRGAVLKKPVLTPDVLSAGGEFEQNEFPKKDAKDFFAIQAEIFKLQQNGVSDGESDQSRKIQIQKLINSLPIPTFSTEEENFILQNEFPCERFMTEDDEEEVERQKIIRDLVKEHLLLHNFQPITEEEIMKEWTRKSVQGAKNAKRYATWKREFSKIRHVGGGNWENYYGEPVPSPYPPWSEGNVNDLESECDM